MNAVDEITLNQVLVIFARKWRYLLILALVFSLGALIKHKYFPVYPGQGKLILKDAKNSQLQMILSSVAGAGLEGALDSKADEMTLRAKIMLETNDYYIDLARNLFDIKNENAQLNEMFQSLKIDSRDSENMQLVANRLSKMINFMPDKAGVINLSTKTKNKELTVILVNEALKEARRNLMNRELYDLNQAEEYFKLEIEQVKKRIDDIEDSTVSKLQKNQILSVDMEKGDSSKYMGELKKNINDAKIAISSNKARIKVLRDALKKQGDLTTSSIGKFNENSQIMSLEEENKELEIQLQSLQRYLRGYENQKTGLVPMQYEIQKMNAAHEFEYKIFVSLNDSLSKIGLQKTYVQNKIAILEKERISQVYSSPGLMIMILIALMFSQILGIFSIYIYELFKPSTLGSAR